MKIQADLEISTVLSLSVWFVTPKLTIGLSLKFTCTWILHVANKVPVDDLIFFYFSLQFCVVDRCFLHHFSLGATTCIFLAASLGHHFTIFATSLNLILSSRHSLSIQISFSNFLLTIFKFFLQLCSHPHISTKRNVLPISEKRFFFCCWRCWAQMSSAFPICRRIRWTLSICFTGFTVRDLSLLPTIWNLLERRFTSAQKSPTSPPNSVLWNKERIKSWERSRCVKFFGPQNWFRYLELLTPVFWKCFAKSSMNLKHLYHSSWQEPIYRWSTALVAEKKDRMDFWSSGNPVSKHNVPFC